MKRVFTPYPRRRCRTPSDARFALVISIVSHGHGVLVQSLLHRLARQISAPQKDADDAPSTCSAGGVLERVVLTLNLPEPEPVPPPSGWPFALEIRRNALPAGFGANHNRALADAQEAFVCILNPDVQLPSEAPAPWKALVQAASVPKVGCTYPVQIDSQGQVQDSERRLPTLPALWRRRILGRAERGAVEWVNGACMVLPRAVWESVGGFDEKFFMYCEDVDLCLRLRLAGLALVRVPVQMIHCGQRASRRVGGALWWHLGSLLRLWTSPVFWQARRLARTGRVSSEADTIQF